MEIGFGTLRIEKGNAMSTKLKEKDLKKIVSRMPVYHGKGEIIQLSIPPTAPMKADHTGSYYISLQRTVKGGAVYLHVYAGVSKRLRTLLGVTVHLRLKAIMVGVREDGTRSYYVELIEVAASVPTHDLKVYGTHEDFKRSCRTLNLYNLFGTEGLVELRTHAPIGG